MWFFMKQRQRVYRLSPLIRVVNHDVCQGRGDGYVVPPQPQHLTKAMVEYHKASQEDLELMSARSSALAELWSPPLPSIFINSVAVGLTLTV